MWLTWTRTAVMKWGPLSSCVRLGPCTAYRRHLAQVSQCFWLVFGLPNQQRPYYEWYVPLTICQFILIKFQVSHLPALFILNTQIMESTFIACSAIEYLYIRQWFSPAALASQLHIKSRLFGMNKNKCIYVFEKFSWQKALEHKICWDRAFELE